MLSGNLRMQEKSGRLSNDIFENYQRNNIPVRARQVASNIIASVNRGCPQV